METNEFAAWDRRARWAGRCAAAAVAAVLWLAGSGSAAASNHAPRDFWGVVPILALSESEIERMGAGRVGSLRHLTLWPQIEPSPGVYDWRYTDFLVANTAAQGIEVLPFLYGTPSWVEGIKCEGLTAEECSRVPPLSGQARTAWSGFLRAMVARYGANGSFWSDTSDEYDPPYFPITHWQIWNEPSSHTYYRPKPNAKGYAKLVKASHDAIAEVDPAAQIVLAGVFTVPEGGPKYRIVPYMTDFFDVRGIRRYFDIAAVHPYARKLKSLKKQIGGLRRVMRRAHVAKKPLWITELGWSSDPPSSVGPLLVGEQRQRDLLAQSLGLLAAKREAWNLAGVTWYSWRDPGYTYSFCTFCAGAGLLQADGTPKPAWQAFVDITGGLAEPPPPPPASDPPPEPEPDPFPILP